MVRQAHHERVSRDFAIVLSRVPNPMDTNNTVGYDGSRFHSGNFKTSRWLMRTHFVIATPYSMRGLAISSP